MAPPGHIPARLLFSFLFVLPAARPAHAADVTLNGQTFRLPDGFVIEQAAGTDLVQRPVSACFDDRGRLFVTDSSGSNRPPAEQLKNPDHRVLCLEDTDGDGRFDRSTVFADRLMFPQGCLWHDGSVYVAGPPDLWKLTDTDGDGAADRREPWYRGGVLSGCANDVHGPALGPDGYIYWTKGAFEKLDLVDGRGEPINDRCAHLLRARPDGSGLESVARFGADNPVGVAFTPDGEPIVCATFLDLAHPGTRDGLVHAVYGGVFGKQNDVVDDPGVRRTGDLLPVMTHVGAGAPADITRYDDAAFGPGYAGNYFTALFNLHKVTRHVLEQSGSTYRTRDEDFVTTTAQDFHPTDVLPAPDGSLLIVDTGGWYKLCCPTSQLAKPDVLGAIYRVRYVGKRHYKAPAARGPTDRQLAELKAASVSRRAADVPALLRTLTDGGGGTATRPARLRVAAEALGRMRHRPAVGPLLGVVPATAGDRFLEHAVVYALGEIGDAAPLRAALGDGGASPAVRRVCLLALGVIGGDAVTAADVIPSLDDEDPAVREAAEWVVRRRPAWGGELARWFGKALRDPGRDPARLAPLLEKLGGDTAVQEVLAALAADPGAPAESREAALRAVAAARPEHPAAAWAPALLASLHEPSTAALDAAAAVPALQASHPTLAKALRDIAGNPAQPDDVRLRALSAVAGDIGEVADPLSQFLVAQLAPARPDGVRRAAADVLARSALTANQRRGLTAVIPAAGPLDLPRILPCFAPGGDEQLGRQLLAALAKARSARTVSPDVLRPALAAFPESVRAEGEQLLGAWKQVNPNQAADLDVTLGRVERLTGDVRRGQAIFMAEGTACTACHQIGYQGGHLGPDLTNIGQIREKRDLLEAILYPSASFVRTFEPVTVRRSKGAPVAGIVRGDSADTLTLATGPKDEVRIPRGQITEVRAGTVSMMPDGLAATLTDQELADLLAFLKNTRWGAE